MIARPKARSVGWNLPGVAPGQRGRRHATRPALVVANDRFRAARKRTASLTYPDESLSRRELAELAPSSKQSSSRPVPPVGQ